MAITSGFFNSKNGDRKYDANQMGSLFGGIITDGVFANYPESGNQLVVSAVSGMQIKVGPGRGWFKNTWIDNSDDYLITCNNSSQAYSRIDSIFIKIDKRNAGRKNSIVYEAGEASSNPAAPSHTDSDEVFWYRLANIAIPAQATSVGTITNYVGTSVPIITAPLEHVSAGDVLAGWKEEVDQIVRDEVNEFLNNPGSILQESIYDVVDRIPAIWISDLDMPTSRGVVMTFETPGHTETPKLKHIFESRTNVDPPHLFPDIPFHIQDTSYDPAKPTPLVPKKYDIVIGKNGYYAEMGDVLIVDYPVPTGVYVWKYRITVHGTGNYIDTSGGFQNNLFFINFTADCRQNPPPGNDIYNWPIDHAMSVSCDKSFDSLISAYEAKKKIIASLSFINGDLLQSQMSRLPHYISLSARITDITNGYGYPDKLVAYFESTDIDPFTSGSNVDRRYFSISYSEYDTQNNISLELRNGSTVENRIMTKTPQNAFFDSNTGIISFVNGNTSNPSTLFSVQIPIYNGDVRM